MFLATQIFMVAYTICAALKDGATIEAFREHVPPGNEYEDPFHFWGAVKTLIVTAALTFTQPTFIDVLITPFVCLLWFWAFCDAAIGWQVHRDAYYLGDTAKLDRIVKYGFFIRIPIMKWRIKIPGLGRNAGELKFFGCIVVIIALNFIRGFLTIQL